MKKFMSFFCIIVASAIIGLLGVGQTFNVFGATRPGGTITIPGVNYVYMSNPIMMASTDTHFFVVNRDIADTHILVMTRGTNNLPPRVIAKSTPFIGPLPLDIHIAGNMLFLFTAQTYFAVPVADMLLSGNMLGTGNNRFDFFAIAEELEFVSPFDNVVVTANVFSVSQVGAYSFRVVHAMGSTYGAHTLTVYGGVFEKSETFIRSVAPRSIRSIAVNTDSEIFIMSNVMPSVFDFAIFASGATSPINTGTEFRFPLPSSMRALAGGAFVFIDHNRNIVLQQGEHLSQISPEQVMGSSANIQTNYDPIFINARNEYEIFVIDQWKNSIDHYRIIDNELEFFATAAGSRGDDMGFFNTPTAMALVGEGVFLVADFSGGIRMVNRVMGDMPTAFISNLSTWGIDIVTAMVFDNNNTVFIASSNGLHRFDLGGNMAGGVITTFTSAGVQTPIGEIQSLVTNPSTHEVFAIATEIGGTVTRLLRFEGGVLHNVALSSDVVLTPQTRLAVDNFNGGMILANVTHGGVTRSIVYADGEVDYVFEFGADIAQVTDVVVDTIGNPIFYTVRTDGTINIVHFMRYTGGVELTFNSWQLDMPNSSQGANVSLQLDRLNNVLYWVGARHGIEAVYLRGDASGEDIWSFRTNWMFNALAGWSYVQALEYNWRGEAVAGGNVAPIARRHEGALFATVTKDVSLFQFPSGINRTGNINTGTRVMILQEHATFPVAGGMVFNYAFVLPVGGIVPRYINRAFLDFEDVYYTTTLMFGPNMPTNTAVPMTSGRVIWNNVPILRFPSTVHFPMRVATVNKNFNAQHDGVTVSRRITVGDIQNIQFFEVRIDANGTPNPHGEFVGFIDVGHMIFLGEPPSQVRLVPNARIMIPSGHATGIVFVYADPEGQSRIDGETLEHRQQIRIRGRLDRNREFTAITYWDDWGNGDGRVNHGYVRTIYIAPDTMSTMQIMGIVLAIVGAIAGIFFIARHIKKRREQI